MAQVVGKPLLELVVERIAWSATLAQSVIATTRESQDDVIEELAARVGCGCYRGSSRDVRLRVLEAAQQARAEVIVQIGADQPFPDPTLNDQLVRRYLEGGCDYISNALDLTYPLGIAAQVYSVDCLAEAEELTRGQGDRAGTSDYLWQNPGRYRIFNLKAPPELTAPHLRLTVDYPEDLELVRRIYETLYPRDPAFTTLDIIELLAARPDWVALNAHLIQNNRIHWVEPAGS
jgi:spore coat polysaccharide biosynthesis protein SpsF